MTKNRLQEFGQQIADKIEAHKNNQHKVDDGVDQYGNQVSSRKSVTSSKSIQKTKTIVVDKK